MESVLTLACIVGLAAWSYKHGKHDGSRAGFRVGWRRGFRNSRNRRRR